jgi:GNAT superfamily N-acetyltransferase
MGGSAAVTLTLHDLAEDAFAYMDGPTIEFDRRAEFVLRNAPNPHPMFGMVLRPRLRDVDQALVEARAWFSARGRTTYTWMVATSSEPSDLVEQLLARGLMPDTDPVSAGMVMEREPGRVDGIEVRKVGTYEESLASLTLAWKSFDFSEEQIEGATKAHRARYDLWKDFQGGDNFIALVDGEIVGSGGAAYLPPGIYLLGGNVAEHMRGRGVYRALVRARWDEAVRRGTPALVVQAGRMSRPILERLGFQTVCEMRTLVDSTA